MDLLLKEKMEVDMIKILELLGGYLIGAFL